MKIARSPLAQRRLAITEFGGDIEFDRHAGQPLEPVFGDETRIARGAAGDDRDALEIPEIERQFQRQRHALGRHVDVARQRMADHLGLLVNFLGHEMAIIGLVDQERRGAGFQHLAVHHRAVLVIDHADFAGQDHPVAVLEIADGIGERRQRDRIRAEIHLAVAMPIASGEPLRAPIIKSSWPLNRNASAKAPRNCGSDAFTASCGDSALDFM
jgi:hypothetical protein